jgi:hypothetical protein
VGDSELTIFLSEKAFKPIACSHPFIFMGNKGSLAKLREIGYKTFDGFIDETYDTLPTWERMQAVTDSIKQIHRIENKIEWYIENIQDVSYIDLEKSKNGYDFELLTTIYTDENKYEYFDYTYSNQNYYRLKIIEKTGEITFSNIIFIESKIDNQTIIYPNPNNGEFTIKSNSKIELIKFYDCLGRYIFELKNPSNTIDVDLPKGLYYLEVNGEFYKVNIYE